MFYVDHSERCNFKLLKNKLNSNAEAKYKQIVLVNAARPHQQSGPLFLRELSLQLVFPLSRPYIFNKEFNSL